MSELSEVHSLGFHHGFTLDSLERVVYSSLRVEVDLLHLQPLTNSQFWRMSGDQVLVILTIVTFCLLKIFTLVLQKMFLNNINKKITYKTLTKISLLFFSFVLCWSPFHTNCNTTFAKTFYFILSNVFFCV